MARRVRLAGHGDGEAAALGEERHRHPLDGIKVPAGVYTWKLQFETKENDYRKIVTGHLNLIR